jgi:Bacterial Ig-like domain (group 3)
MWFSSVPGRPTSARKPNPRFRPQLECLEDRSVPAVTTTTLTSSLNPASFGQPITFTATVTGGDIPAGSGRDGSGFDDVTFFDGARPLLTVKPTPTGGPNHESRAQFTSSRLDIGTHVITARYDGGTFFDSGSFFTNNSSASKAVNEVINAPPIAADVSAAVSVTRVPLPGLRNAAVQLVRLRNTGAAAVGGPIMLVLHGLRRGVRLKGASGVAQQHGRPGDPFLALDVTLLPGGELTLVLLFSNPTRRNIRFTAQVLAGAGTV